MSDEYFDPYVRVLKVLFWAKATQIQMERWEPLVAQNLASELQKSTPKPATDIIWRIDIERHFVLVAAAQLISALKFAQFAVQAPAEMAAQIEAGRDLNEHWQDNMPIFNTHPRTGTPPRDSGKAFAASNPRSGPYGGWNWHSNFGPLVLPKVPASRLQDLVQRVKERAVADSPNLGDFVHEWQASPWVGGDDPNNRWYPRSLLVE